MDRRSFVKTLRDGVSGVHERRQGTLSYAQQGEDLVVQNILAMVGVKGPITYVDIGAYDPIFSSNSYAFYLAGGHGVLVEPNPPRSNGSKRFVPETRC